MQKHPLRVLNNRFESPQAHWIIALLQVPSILFSTPFPLNVPLTPTVARRLQKIEFLLRAGVRRRESKLHRPLLDDRVRLFHAKANGLLHLVELARAHESGKHNAAR
jgi:hypothetical protein